MKSLKAFLVNSLCVAVIFGQFGCHHGDPAVSTPTPASSAALTISGPNVMQIQMGGSAICNVNSINLPCTSVTICSPTTTGCQTISDILVDTGSSGLRIFSSVISVPLTQMNDSNNHPIAECEQFGIGATWGPVMKAQLNLASENPVTVPIQVINASYNKVPSTCPSPDSSPTGAGFNGILGVGLFMQDCGPGCATTANNGIYFSCTGSGCTGVKVSTPNQVTNPVLMFTPLPGASVADNNGVLIAMPPIPANGAVSVTGALVFGIGTQPNNTPPSGALLYTADNFGDLTTKFNGNTYGTQDPTQNSQSFIDSGSNGIFFPPAGNTPLCPDGSGFFCPSSPVSLSSTMIGADGKTTTTIPFSIGNETVLFSSGNIAFNNLGGDGSGANPVFDWGFPFFFGRYIYVGLETKTYKQGSTTWTGPYWAF